MATPDPTPAARVVADALIKQMFLAKWTLWDEIGDVLARALDSFAAEAVKAEREAIVVLVKGDGFLASNDESALFWVAAAIRARGDTPGPG